jgi:carbonic anhydrase/acetyltransferase-like protein (isoleucine patch superfamily)
MSVRCIDGVYLADTARIFGEVEIGVDSSLWYGAAVRGDVAPVTIGSATNIQDNAVVHCDTDIPNHIGRHVTIGHGAVVHGQRVGDHTMIGMGATVLGRTVIGSHCLIAAGAVVPPGLEVPDGMLVMGVPGRIIGPVSDKQRRYLEWAAQRYVDLARLYVQRPDDPRVADWTARRHAAITDAPPPA